VRAEVSLLRDAACCEVRARGWSEEFQAKLLSGLGGAPCSATCRGACLFFFQSNMTTSMSTSELAAMLRRSADIVERGEFNPLLYQTMKALTKYAGDYADGGISSSSGSTQKQRRGHNSREVPTEKNGKKGAFHDVPDTVLDGGNTGKGRSSERDGEHSHSSVKPSDKGHKGVFSLKGIKKGIEKIGNDILGDHRDEHAPFDEKVKSFETSNDEYQDKAPASVESTEQQEKPTKPCFQRPINPSSNLIANGWIDQQRRSKMRVVWKDVLASLVEGRRPGEETTLWIQRQVVSPQTGKVTGLEALHQIPMKWLEDVNYVDLYSDHRFTLKVFNIAEEFYFRTRDEQSAQNWVLTLRSARDASLDSNDRMKQNDPVAESSGAKPPGEEIELNDLNDWDSSRPGRAKPSGKIRVGNIPEAQAGSEDSDRPSSSSTSRAQQRIPQPTSSRLPISELRSIAHGAGYNTRGMERQDLERIAAHLQGGNPSPQTQSSSAPNQSSANQMHGETARREAERAAAKERQEQDLAESRRRQKAKENEERIAENMRKEREESERQRVEDQRTAEMKRRQELEEQASEIKRQQEAERQRRMAELQAAERARQQQAYQQQQHATQQAQYHHQQQQQQQQQAYQRAQYQQQQSYQQAQYQQQQQQQQQANFGQFFNQQMPPNPGVYSPQQHQQQQPSFRQHQAQGQPPQQNGSAHIPAKYDEKSDEELSAATTQIKRNILINWALLPPNLNVLRPIDQLVTTIHTAMPPAFGVSGHTYFTKFTPIAQGELVASAAMGNRPDETKLKKAVRKVRVFLHPDKLPRDLTSEQSFTARMLWDITSDSWEEFQKHKEDLDWING